MPDNKTEPTFLGGQLPIGTGWRGTMQIKEDFMGGEIASGKLGECNWYTFYANAEVNAGIAGESMRIDNLVSGNALIMITGTMQSSVAIASKKAAVSGGTAGGVFLPSAYFDYVIGFRHIPAATLTTELSMIIGLTDNPAIGVAWNNFMGIANGASGLWNALCIAGGASTVGSGVFVRNTSYSRLRIRRVNATDIAFSLNESAETIISSNVPTAAMMPVVYLKANTATSVNMAVTHMHLTVGAAPNFMSGR